MTLEELLEAVQYFESEHHGDDELHEVLHHCREIIDEIEFIKEARHTKEYEKTRAMAYRHAQGQL